MPMPASRKLYASKLSAGNPSMTTLTTANIDAADLGLQAFTASPAPAPNDPGYPLAGSSAVNAEGLADEIVQVSRGCVFGTGVTSADVSAPGACIARDGRLGDIFHADPVIVKQPAIVGGESSSAQFRVAYSNRSRRIYTGTNAGFLEAFDAGLWNTSPVPPVYTSGSGAEVFGFMPWAVRQNIKNQVVDSPTSRTYYVDGSPQAADVWRHSAWNDTTKSVAEWRTLLVAGLRQGGRHYYALDVTNPDGVTGPAGNLPYPGYLWEFPNEADPDDPSNSASFLPYMG
jgi:Tfp pilus tip-associated adhesin PilY1